MSFELPPVATHLQTIARDRKVPAGVRSAAAAHLARIEQAGPKAKAEAVEKLVAAASDWIAANAATVGELTQGPDGGVAHGKGTQGKTVGRTFAALKQKLDRGSAAMPQPLLDALAKAAARGDRPGYMVYDYDGRLKSIVARPTPNGARFPEEERQKHEVKFDAAGRLEWARGEPIDASELRLVLRDDGKLYATPVGGRVREFQLGEEHGMASIGVTLEQGLIQGFEERYSDRSGAEYDTTAPQLALLFLALEAMGGRIAQLNYRHTPKYSWESYDSSVDDFLRGFAKPNSAREEKEQGKLLAQLASARSAQQESKIGQTPDVGPEDKGVRRDVGGLQIPERPKGTDVWKLIEKIRQDGDHVVVPTPAGELRLAIGETLSVVPEGGPARPLEANEITALAQVLGPAASSWQCDVKLVSMVLAALEKSTGPLWVPVDLAGWGAATPKGLVAARFIGKEEYRAPLLREQGPNDAARDYARGATWDGYANGLRGISPDGKSQYLVLGNYDNGYAARLVALANATGRTIHAQVRDYPIYAKPGDQAWSVESQMREFEESMGQIQKDSKADRRKTLNARGKVDTKDLIVHLKNLGDGYGDYRLAGLAYLTDPAQMKELVLHMRDTMPPEAVRNMVMYAVGHRGQVVRGTEQAWVDIMKRALVG